MNHTVFNTGRGSVRICSLWDFMTEVKIHRLHESVALELANRTRDEYRSATMPKYGIPEGPIMSRTSHVLKQNPLKVLVELKKTTTKRFFKSKNVDLFRMLEELSTDSMTEFGNPTHFFSIGMGRYVLVDVKDICLFVNKNYNQTLVCTAPKRNYTIYAPNLKVGE